MTRSFLQFSVLLLSISAAWAQKVDVQEIHLDNGMTVLMVPRKGDPNVAAGWVARVGSVTDRPGITGISRVFEQMMFKGTRAVGTSNIEEDLKTLHEMDTVHNQIRHEEEALI